MLQIVIHVDCEQQWTQYGPLWDPICDATIPSIPELPTIDIHKLLPPQQIGLTPRYSLTVYTYIKFSGHNRAVSWITTGPLTPE